MKQRLAAFATAGPLLVAMTLAPTALALNPAALSKLVISTVNS